MIGETIGPYRVLGKLGEGGMGEVYKARDTRLERDVAVKILPAHLDNPEARARFERESKAVAALNHPHILTLFDIGSEGGVAYAVTELLEGRTLRAVLSESGALPWRKAVDYALQIAHGLAAAHAKGITHRDLKPENVIVGSDGQIKILDFGLAKISGAVAPGGASQLTTLVTQGAGTAAGTVLGTVGYMAPEQVRGLDTDPRTDLFALGAILFELVTGARAFAADSAVETMSAILKNDPLDLPPSATALPAGIERVVRHALEKQPDERYQTARDFAYDLRALLQSSTLATSTANPAFSEAARQLSSPRRSSWIPWLGAVAMLLTGVGLGFVVGRSSRPTTTPSEVGRFAIAAPEKTTFPIGSGAAPWPALSPDGLRLVFAAASTSGGPPTLWMRVMGSVAAQPIPGTEGAVQPFWSPDGRYLAFFADGKLKKLDLTGGTPQTICDASADPRKGTWGKDGVILFALRDLGLFRASSTTTGRTPMPVPSGSEFSELRYPSFLPDGHRFIALGYVGKPGTSMDPTKSAVVAGSIDPPGDLSLIVRGVAEAQYVSGYLVYVRDGNLVGQRFDVDRLMVTGEAVTLAEGVSFTPDSGIAAFSAAPSILVHAPSLAGLGGQLSWYDRQGHVVGDVALAGDVRSFDVSPHGVLAHVHDETTGGDVWRYTLSGGSPTRLTSPPAHNVAPLWSPDGTAFAFARAKSGHDQMMGVYRRRVDAAAGEELLFGPKPNAAPTSWSADGRYLFVQVNGGDTNADVWIVPLVGDRTPRPLLATKDAEYGARLSPDGKWLAYAVGTSPGVANVYLQAFPDSAGPIQISTGVAAYPVWSRSGRELFFLTRDQGIAVVSIEETSSGILPSTPRVLFRAPIVIGGNVAPFGVAPDGQQFLVASNSSRATRSMIMTTGWTSLFSAAR